VHDVDLVGGQRGGPQVAVLEARQPHVAQVLSERELVGRHVGALAHVLEDLVQGRLGVFAATVAALGLLPAFLGLLELAAALGALV
jgi:hypothetical protein